MKAVCPNGCALERFITVAHVTEDWIVDSEGQFQEIHPASEAFVAAEPNPGNNWHCFECGNLAKVTS